MFTNKSPEDYLEKIEEYLNQGEYEKVIKEYENTLNADPDFFYAWNDMGVAYANLFYFVHNLFEKETIW